MPCLVIAGLGWGDEGKGKIIDYLAAKADIIVRGQGGHNAGHTVITEEGEFHFHLIPSGILHPNAQCLLGAGVTIEPGMLLSEIENLEGKGVEVRGRLLVSPYAQLIFPYHSQIDQAEEASKEQKIGTTGRGIGPSYADRVSRKGVRMGDLLDLDGLKRRLEKVIEWKNLEVYAKNISFENIYKLCVNWSEKLSPFIHSFESDLYKWVKQDRRILVEGAQGALLDNTFGTYPFVTSSSTISAGILAGAGLGIKNCKSLGILKAYATRVGEGPFPTEIADSEELFPREKSREIGTTTGRKRRIGWFDGVLTRFALEINGAEYLALTKLDVLDDLEQISVCHAYKLSGKRITSPPASIDQWEKIEPVYETLPGWKCKTGHLTSFKDLPENMKVYIRYLEEMLDLPIGMISLGPKRDQLIVRTGNVF